MPETHGKGVPFSRFSAYYSGGNLLHTGGVGSSILSPPTNISATFGSVKKVPFGFVEPEGRTFMARHSNELPQMSAGDWRRFWAKVDRSGGLFACWPWKAAKSGFGYGRFKLDGKLWSPHRLAASAREGGIPASASYHGFVVMHTCDNPACCNPAHLQVGTHAENVRDMDRKGRRPLCARTQYPAETIIAIRQADGSSREIAKRFGLSDGYVRQIRRGETRRGA